MKLRPSEIPFLKGEKFSNNLLFPLQSESNSKLNRLEYLRKLVQGKKVIHVGCVDHMPLIEEKRKQGNWLHEILVKSAVQCVGIDINASGCQFVRDAGFKEIYTLDIIKDMVPPEIKAQKFDYLVLGEMIEHVDNPVEFLSAVRQKFSGVAETLVTTTPNVFRIQNLVHTLRGREYINSDHRYWFSPYTLAKVLSQAGYNDVDIETVWYTPLRGLVTGGMKSMIATMFPVTKDCLIAKANLTTQ